MGRIVFGVLFCSLFVSNAFASETKQADLWPTPENAEPYDSVKWDEPHELVPNAKKIILKCIEASRPAKDCTAIVHNNMSCGAQIHQGACNDIETSIWSEIGWEYYNKLKAQQPEFAENLQDAQRAWRKYSEQQCKYASRTGIYNDFPLPLPPWLEWRDYTLCVLNDTAERTILLHTLYIANKHHEYH